MRLTRSGKPGRAPMLEIWDLAGAITNVPGTIGSPRALYTAGSDGLDIGPLYTLGGGSIPNYITRNGLYACDFAPGSAQIAARTMGYGFPLNRAVSLYPASFRPQRRWIWEMAFERAAFVGTAIAEIGMHDDPANNIDAVNSLGLVIRSAAGVNAGRWTLYYKPNGAPGAGVVQSTDLGVSALGVHHIKFEYFDIVVPSLNIYIDGSLKVTVPAATLITLDSNEPLPLGVQSGDPGGTIGQHDYMYESHFLIEQI